MGPIEGLMLGFEVAFAPEHLLAALIGALAGTLFGLLPGLGSTAAVALLFPITLAMGPTAGLIMIAGIYYGIMYGGSTTAVLLNIPGEPPSIVAAIEGYPMAQRGRPGPALGIIAIASFVAGTTSVLLVALFSPLLANVGLMFQSAEFFALTFGGLLVLAKVFGDRATSGLLPMGIGLAIGTIGVEGQTGQHRFTFGILELVDGIPLVVVAVGVFGIAELIRLVGEDHGTAPRLERLKVRDLAPSREELRRSVPSWARGGIVGFFFGLLPGPSGAMSTFASYKLEKSVSKHGHEFGKQGVVEGLAGPEAANNAAATSSIVPLLVLGIPFSSTLALMLGALLSHGITPGPLVATSHPDLFWGVIASMFIGNVMLLVINVPCIGVWVSLMRVPMNYLAPIVALLALIGAFAIRNRVSDVFLVIGFGLVGLVLSRYDFSLAPVLVGLILSPLIEKHFREGLIYSQGDISYLFASSPIVIAIWTMVGLSVVWPIVGRLVRAFGPRAKG